ncbi:hypothetical protein BGZ67_005430 [Mortierella alpina]|nr:hypothetical protein BGZ67_005430 [Mortierella alpina]
MKADFLSTVSINGHQNQDSQPKQTLAMRDDKIRLAEIAEEVRLAELAQLERIRVAELAHMERTQPTKLTLYETPKIRDLMMKVKAGSFDYQEEHGLLDKTVNTLDHRTTRTEPNEIILLQIRLLQECINDFRAPLEQPMTADETQNEGLSIQTQKDIRLAELAHLERIKLAELACLERISLAELARLERVRLAELTHQERLAELAHLELAELAHLERIWLTDLGH